MIAPDAGDEGRAVLYWRPDGRHLNLYERGLISSWNEHYVFVRYTRGMTADATRREDLIWEDEAPVGTQWRDRIAGEYHVKGLKP